MTKQEHTHAWEAQLSSENYDKPVYMCECGATKDNMERKTYAVAVKRTNVDYLLITASSEKDAMTQAEFLMEHGEYDLILGDDPQEEELLDAIVSECRTDSEKKSRDTNDDAMKEMEYNQIITK